MAIIEILDDSGTVVNTVVGGATWAENNFPGKWRLGAQPEPTPPGTRVTKLAFKNRFPRAKWVAAKQAAKLDPALEDFFEDFDIAKFIDLSYPATVAGVTSLTDVAVPVEFRLTQEEADAVLLAPVTEDELP